MSTNFTGRRSQRDRHTRTIGIQRDSFRRSVVLLLRLQLLCVLVIKLAVKPLIIWPCVASDPNYLANTNSSVYGCYVLWEIKIPGGCSTFPFLCRIRNCAFDLFGGVSWQLSNMLLPIRLLLLGEKSHCGFLFTVCVRVCVRVSMSVCLRWGLLRRQKKRAQTRGREACVYHH